MTWIPTEEGWLYLASVIDLASQHLLGYAMSIHHDAALVVGALDAAVATHGRSRLPDTSFHTDRGAEYSSHACGPACQRLGLRRSMSRTGSCLDNAVAESWFASLKVEPVHRQHYRTRAEARAAIFSWIAWDNRFRLHSANGYLSPIEWEQQHDISPLLSTMAASPRCPPPGGRSNSAECRAVARERSTIPDAIAPVHDAMLGVDEAIARARTAVEVRPM